MEDKKEITAVDYDGLLRLFCCDDYKRPHFYQPNTVGNNTYASDGHHLVIIPNELLRLQYPAHEKVPDYQLVIDQIKPCEPVVYKDTDLFRIMEVHPMVNGVEDCEDCDGDGKCPHCGHECNTCDGSGHVENERLPKVYSEKATIQIGEHKFTPHRLSIVDKTVAKLMVDTFELIGVNKSAALFKVGPIQILLSQGWDDDEQRLNVVLNPMQKH
jgi:hypothetical protein